MTKVNKEKSRGIQLAAAAGAIPASTDNRRHPATTNYVPPDQFIQPTVGTPLVAPAAWITGKSTLFITSATADQALRQDGNDIEVAARVGFLGGVAPYDIKFVWSDGRTQENTSGVVQRSFRLDQKIPGSVKIIVTSFDKQVATTTISITNQSSHIGGYHK